MESFILNLANGWTIVDLTIMFILLLVAFNYYKDAKSKEEIIQAKETLLKFTDIEREQSKEDRKVAEKELEIAYQRIEVLNNGNKTLIENRDYWKERTLHKKHTSKKVIDSENWKCINQHYLNFSNGVIYKKDSSQTPTSDSLLFLNCNDGHSYLVEKKYFHPVN